MRNFNHTVGVLVNAYINGTLQHTNCYACAVGNMIAASRGYKFVYATDNRGQICWDVTGGKYCTSGVAEWFAYLTHRSDNGGVALKEIEATGYSVEEIRMIEAAFEHIPGHGEDTDGYNGLMSVVDVLADIHGIDLSVREETKKLFVKA